MKKVYISPRTLVLELQFEELMAASLTGGESGNDGDTAESRKFGRFWEDDDYDDYE